MQNFPSRAAQVGGIDVRRALPQRARRTIGAWCFVDHFGPTRPDRDEGLEVGPHPHCGLSTVTWLVDGTAVHTDSLGSEQPIRPGQLNLMTAGVGISHAEETPVDRRGPLHGVQFWVAQPEATRHGAAAFEHHAELPVTSVGTIGATVLLGSFGGERSPARTDTALMGVELTGSSPTHEELPLERSFEHGVVVLEGAVRVDGDQFVPGQLGYLPAGAERLLVEADAPVRWLLIGGEPFEAPVQMWWNFVGRTRDEMTAAVQDWNDRTGRFGTVDSGLEPVPAPVPTWDRTG